MLRSHNCTLTLAASVSILFTVAAGCHTTNIRNSPSPQPGPTIEHAPPHEEHHRFTYVHYPSCNVYYDRERRVWFWIEGRDWRMGVALPSHIRIDTGEAVTIELETDKPYESTPLAPPHPMVEHGPPSHAPAHGYRSKFTYVHYPSCNVYCDRERHLWFWYEGNEWKRGAELPAHFRVDSREEVKVELDEETPYAHGNSNRAHANGKGNDASNGHVTGNSDGKSSSPSDDKSKGHGNSQNKGPSHGKSDSHSNPLSDGQNSAPANDSNDSQSTSQGKGKGDAQGKSQSDGQSGTHGNDQGDAQNKNKGQSESSGPSDAKSKGQTDGKNKGQGKGQSNDASKSSSDAHGKDQSTGQSDTQSNGKGNGKDKGKDKDKDKGDDKGKDKND